MFNTIAKNISTDKKKLFLFDLDRTIVDSDHRTPYKEDGSLDLNKYRNMQTIEHMMKDKHLPLFDVMKDFIEDGKEVGIVTARFMRDADYDMLRQSGIDVPLICARNLIHKVKYISGSMHKHYKMSDGEYKRIWFKHIKSQYDLNDYEIFMYDDHQAVLKVAKEEGFHALDAIQLNKMLGGNYANFIA